MQKDMFFALKQSITNLEVSKAANLAKEVVEKGIDPVEAIESGYVQGLSIVGERFQRGQLFLPELMAAAKAMQEALKILEPEIKKKKKTKKILGRIVIGTVEGDLHDIGKNIVAAMFFANGFEVFDLGRNVPAGSFIDKAQDVGADIIACSALLSTTMPAQARVIKILISQGVRKRVKVMLGGAPVTQDWAKSVGADGYAENAVEAVSVAKELLNIDT